MSKKIYIITNGYFPRGDAGSIRLLMIGRALNDAGFEVIVLCRGGKEEHGEIFNIQYFSLRSNAVNMVAKVFDYCAFPRRVKEILKSDANVNCVYVYNAHISVFRFCKTFCIQNHIALIHDCVEWYSSDEFRLGKLNPWYQVKNYINTKVIDRNFKVVSISRYLKEYYTQKGIDTIRVPALCDHQQRCQPKQSAGTRLSLLYAGASCRKDLIGNLLFAIQAMSDEEKKNISVTLIGASKHSLMKNSGISMEIIDACAGTLNIIGRIPRESVLEQMEDADFVVLPRDASKRYAKAGFPSKVTESLANATPVLCNLSSDLDLYLKDGYNAIIAEDHTPEKLLVALRRAMKLKPDEKLKMSHNAMLSARELLDYRLYIDPLRSFVDL